MAVVSLAPEGLPAGEVPAMVAVLAGMVREDRQDGLEEDGHTAMVLGDHPDGKDLDTPQATVLITALVGDQVGYLSLTTTIIITSIMLGFVSPATTILSGRLVSRFRSPTVLGANLLRAPMCLAAPMNITALVSFLI
jgi:hypothetical protein